MKCREQLDPFLLETPVVYETTVSIIVERRHFNSSIVQEALLTGALIEQTKLHTVTLLAQRSFIVGKYIVRLGTLNAKIGS